MSRNFNPRRKPERMAKAAVQGMRFACRPVAGMALRGMALRGMALRGMAKRQIIGHIPAEGCDPMEMPDL